MRITTTISLLFLSIITFSQTKYSSTILDQNGFPLAGIIIQDPNGICKTLSDNNGVFNFECESKVKTIQFIYNGEVVQLMDESSFTTKGNNKIILNIEKPIVDNNQINVVNLPANDDGDEETEEVSSLLAASSDVFSSIAGFNFSAASFKIRGYDSDLESVYINGVPTNDPESGNGIFSTWGGLNDVMRTDQFIIGLNMVPYGFGDFGGNVVIDATASTQRVQKKLSYQITNRAFQHRIMGTWSTGVQKNGWAFSLSASRRWATEGYVPGSTYDAWSYYLGAEKRFKNGDNLALTIFGAPSIRGRAGVSIQEMYDLAGTNYYNPYWGFQNGEKRNSKESITHLPTAILNYEKKFSTKTQWANAVSFQTGREGTTGLDWFNAPDPRPDYYKKLPSYAQSEESASAITDVLKSSEAARQIDWDALYQVNKFNTETVNDANGIKNNSVTGLRSLYCLNERRTDNTTAILNSYVKHSFSDKINFSGGLVYKWYEGRNYQTLNDLLGGDFIVDVDQFSERDFPQDSLLLQNDLDKTNKIIKVGDTYGYNYNSEIREWSPWAQVNVQLKKIDFFVSAKAGETSIWREGLVKNGRFPETSKGVGEKHDFTTYGAKAGITLKVNNKNYFYLQAGYLTDAPQFRDMYISPKLRADVADNLTTEKTLSGEAGYIMRSPVLKIRLSLYYTQFRDQIKTTSYYDDFERTFINYTLSGIGKTHMGTELGLEYKLSPSFTLLGAANLGDYFYDKRPIAKISKDNDAALLSDGITVYWNDFFIANTPQTALGAGLKYNSKSRWYASVNVSYFDKMYVDIAAGRRTAEAVAGLDNTSPQWKVIIDQEKLKPAYTVDLSIGKSFYKWNHYFNFNFIVNNLLNQTNFKTGGFEQLRYDPTAEGIKFPSKYFYMYGLSYSASLSVSF